MSLKTPTALIAEDEPLLALALQAELARVWPALQIAATVGDGLSALAQARALRRAAAPPGPPSVLPPITHPAPTLLR